jgi:hypothetical protein
MNQLIPMTREEREEYRLKRAAIIADRKPPSVVELARVKRAGALWHNVRTIEESYIADREIAQNREERNAVWRTYTRAMLTEMLRRRICQGLPYRETKQDEGLPIAFLPFWKTIPDVDLLNLQEALIRARFRG